MMSIQVVFSRLSCMLICAFLFLLTGCSKQTDLESVDAAVTEYVESRPSGQVILGAQDEVMQTAFFSFKLLSASTKEYYTVQDNVYSIEDGYQFLVCKFSVTNTSNQDIEMFVDDFAISFEEGSVDYGYGYSSTNEDGYMEDSLVLESGETMERMLMYLVPVKDNYTLIYDEFYADGYQGNQYQIVFSAE